MPLCFIGYVCRQAVSPHHILPVKCTAAVLSLSFLQLQNHLPIQMDRGSHVNGFHELTRTRERETQMQTGLESIGSRLLNCKHSCTLIIVMFVQSLHAMQYTQTVPAQTCFLIHCNGESGFTLVKECGKNFLLHLSE